MENYQVIISKKIGKAIELNVSNTGEITSTLSLLDFIEAVVEGAGNPTLLVTKAQLLSRLKESATKVVSEMKELTRHVV